MRLVLQNEARGKRHHILSAENEAEGEEGEEGKEEEEEGVVVVRDEVEVLEVAMHGEMNGREEEEEEEKSDQTATIATEVPTATIPTVLHHL